MRAPFLSFLVLTIALAGAARADDTPREAAAAHYARGIDLANQGLYEAALEQFNNAYIKSPHFAVLYNIGQAQIALGRPLEAIAALSKYMRDGAEQVPLSRREQVQAQINLLESRIAELTIATDLPGAVIRVDGREVGRAPLFQPIRLAAGSHTISATLANGAELTRSVLLGEAERQRLQLDLAAVAPRPAPPPGPTVVAEASPTLLSQPAAPATPPAPSGPRGETMRRASYILAGAGVLATGAALGVYLRNRDRYADWQAGNERLQQLTPGSASYFKQVTSNNDLASSLTSANQTILGLSVVGGALVAAGVTLFLIDQAERQRTGALSFGWGGEIGERRLERPMVSAKTTMVLVLAALGAAGCFDVHTVDTGPLVIDDFDDGDYYPADPDFDSWTCYSFNPDSNKMYRCDHEPRSDADGEGYALFLDFTITDPQNGSQDHGGASLATFANTPVDFTRFSELVFSNWLESGNPPLPSNAQFYVELGCSTAPDSHGDVPGDFYVSRGVDYNNNWKARTATLANFGPPAWINAEIRGGTAGCLALVDSIRFTIDAQLPDDQVGHGTLHIDSISLQ